MLVVSFAPRILGEDGSLCERRFAPSARSPRVPLRRESHPSPVFKDFVRFATIRKCTSFVSSRLQAL